MNAEPTAPVPSDGSTPSKPAPPGSEKARAMSLASRRHVIPFAVWMALLFAVDVFNLADDPSKDYALNWITLADAYAWRAGLGLLALLWLRPWRYYEALQRRHLLPAVGLGIGVFVLWVGFESALVQRLLPGLSEAYQRWGVFPFGELREVATLPDGTLYQPYNPAVCGWTLTLVRLAGSAFVIAIIEEFFWRGFLYRWVRSLDFLDIDPGVLHWPAFLGVAAVFGIEHSEWLAGMLTGLAYGYFYIRTRDVWAVALAHVVTNLLLGLYVLGTGAYHFW